MRKIALLILLILPTAASATKLAVCDGKSYDVTITNGGQTHVVHLTPSSGAVEEFGPQVTMEIKGQPPVRITEQYDEYCIWSGRIKLQQVRSGNDSLSGGDAR